MFKLYHCPPKALKRTDAHCWDAEILQASIKAGSVAQIVVAVIAVIGLVYLLKLVLVTTLSSVVSRFAFEPVSNLARDLSLAVASRCVLAFGDRNL